MSRKWTFDLNRQQTSRVEALKPIGDVRTSNNLSEVISGKNAGRKPDQTQLKTQVDPIALLQINLALTLTHSKYRKHGNSPNHR
jgi:hypothetical protein